jgi:hypothetical protein
MLPRLYSGWLDQITNWLREQLLWLWSALIKLLKDMVVALIEGILDLFATAIEAIPTPQFLTNYSLDTLLGNAGPTVGWIMGTFRISDGLGLIAAGYGFRFLRKLFTLFQW